MSAPAPAEGHWEENDYVSGRPADYLVQILLHLTQLGHRPTTTATRTQILEKAIVLLARRGYAGTSMRDIARQVGIKAASLYTHFPNGKPQLVMDSLTGIFDQFLDHMVTGLDQNASAAAQVWHVIQRHVSWQVEYAEKAAAWDTAMDQFGVTTELDPQIIDESRRRQELYHAYFVSLVHQIRPDAEARPRALGLLQMCDRAKVFHSSSGGDFESHEQVAQFIWSMAIDLIPIPAAEQAID